MRWLIALLALLCAAGVLQWWQTGGIAWLGVASVTAIGAAALALRRRTSQTQMGRQPS